jgi:hypothetical protein
MQETRSREVFIEVPPENEPSDPPRPDSPWLAARRKSWARLIRRVYEVDPLLCRCGERMRAAFSCLRLGYVEVILGFVVYPSHFARLRLVTGFGRRSAADGMHTLDALYLTEDSGPRR